MDDASPFFIHQTDVSPKVATPPPPQHRTAQGHAPSARDGHLRGVGADAGPVVVAGADDAGGAVAHFAGTVGGAGRRVKETGPAAIEAQQVGALDWGAQQAGKNYKEMGGEGQHRSAVPCDQNEKQASRKARNLQSWPHQATAKAD